MNSHLGVNVRVARNASRDLSRLMYLSFHKPHSAASSLQHNLTLGHRLTPRPWQTELTYINVLKGRAVERSMRRPDMAAHGDALLNSSSSSHSVSCNAIPCCGTQRTQHKTTDFLCSSYNNTLPYLLTILALPGDAICFEISFKQKINKISFILSLKSVKYNKSNIKALPDLRFLQKF
jgi:hypothetical protein